MYTFYNTFSVHLCLQTSYHFVDKKLHEDIFTCREGLLNQRQRSLAVQIFS